MLGILTFILFLEQTKEANHCWLQGSRKDGYSPIEGKEDGYSITD